MEELKDNFLEYLKLNKNYSDHTILNYEIDLDHFFKYLKKEEMYSLELINYNVIRFYIISLSTKRKKTKNIDNINDISKTEKDTIYSENSISRKISTLKSFFSYLLREDHVLVNPMDLIVYPKIPKKLPKFLYSDEIEKLFSVCDTSTNYGVRDQLILEMLYGMGIRVAELVEINISDIDLSNRIILIRGKGNKERYVPFSNYINDCLISYMSGPRLEMLKKDITDALLLNNRGTRLTTRGVRYIIDKIIKQTSLNVKLTPHVLRHTFATHMLNGGADLRVVQELLGHESLSSTQVYTHVTKERLKNIYIDAHPRVNFEGDKNDNK